MASSSSFDLIRSRTMKIGKPALVAPDSEDEILLLSKQSPSYDIALNAFNSLQSFLIKEKKIITPQSRIASQKLLKSTSGSSLQAQRSSRSEHLMQQFSQQIKQLKADGYDYEEGQQNFDDRYDTKSRQTGEYEFQVKSEAKSTRLFYHFINTFRVNHDTGDVQVEASEYDGIRDSRIQVKGTYPTRWADGTVHQFFVLTQRLPSDIEWRMKSIRAEKVLASSVTLPSIPLGRTLILKPGQQAFYAFLLGQPGALRMSVLHAPGRELSEVHITKGDVAGFYKEIVIYFSSNDDEKELSSS